MDLSKRIQRRKMYEAVPFIKCKDGFIFSVQAGTHLYCKPRQHFGPWTHVEVGFPSQTEETLMPYIDDDRDIPIDAVYACVPVEVVEQIIRDHGGEDA